MNILAGCDLVSEISHAALLKQLRSTPLVDGQSLQTPFELSVTGKTGTAHVMVDSVEVNINGDDTVTVTFVFTRSSLTSLERLSIPGIGKPPASLYPISGTITINLKVALVPVAPRLMSVALDFFQCPVSLNLSAESRQLIQLAAVSAHRTATQLTAELEGAIRDYVQSRPKAVLPGGYSVTPDTDGSLQPLAFRTLRLRCFGPADQGRQGIGLFGNFFADTKDAGNPSSRESSAVPAGEDTLVTLSLRSFQTFLFCPSLASSLSARLGRPQPLPVEEMPTTCGRGASVDLNGVTITGIDAFFGQGRIQLNVAFHKVDTCYESSGTMVTYVRLAANGAVIVPTLEPQAPNIHTEVNFWCELAGWVVFGFFDTLLIQSLEDSIDDVAGKIGVSTVAAMTGQPLQAPSSPGVLLTAVTVTPTELSLSGRLQSYQPPAPGPELSLTQVHKIAISPETRPHVWITQLWCQNEVKDYWYFETLQTQSQKYRVDAKLIALPLSVVYSVRGGVGPWQSLTDAPGSALGGLPSVTVTNLQCRYPTPLSAGGSVVVRDVSLRYALDGNAVTLISGDGQGNFAVDLRAEVHDAMGQLPPGVDAAPTVSMFFDSDIVVMDDQYTADLKKCADLVKAASEKHAKSQRTPRWKQQFNPAEREIVDDLDLLSALGTTQGDDMARHFRNAQSAILGRVAAARLAADAGGTAGTDSALVAQQLEATIGALQLTLSQVRMRQ